jgi:multidrug efflux pump subunit AcrA (membrane-fusion protein)
MSVAKEPGMHRPNASSLIALALGIGLSFAPGTSRAAGEPAEPARGPAPAVSVATVSRTCLAEQVFFTGVTAARDEILVFPQAEGAQVAELLVAEGDRVTAGQVLARLTDSPAGGANRDARTKTVDVTAPASGVVVRRSVRVGSVVSASSPEPPFRIAQDGNMVIEADVPEVHLAKISPGQSVQGDVLGVGTVTGKVLLVSPEIDRQTRLGRVRISLDPNPALRFGAAVMGSIETGRSCGLAVPLSALVTRGVQTVVQRVRDNRIETKPVKLGLVEGGRAEVVEGLAEGDTVVSRAGTFVRDGDVVRPVPAPLQADAAAGEPRR